MNRVQDKLFLVGICLVIFIGLSSCSATEIEQEIALLPLSLNWQAKSKTIGLSEFGCMVSTLAKNNEEHSYHYQGFELDIPTRIIDESEGKVKLASFRLTHPSVQKENIDEIKPEDFVRVVKCKIPDHPEVVSVLTAELTKYGTDTWATKDDNSINRKSVNSGEWVQSCSIKLTGVSYIISNGEITGWNYYYSQVCTWDYVASEDDFGGGDGDIGGGDDPEPPCGPWEICGDDGSAPPGPTDCAGVTNGLAYLDICNICVAGTTGKIDCCATQSKILDRVIEDEGGYVNNPNDKGGATNYGISQFIWNAGAQSVLGIDPSSTSISTITEEQARQLYDEMLWGPSNSHAISKLDGDLATMYFNFYVNTPKGAGESLQYALIASGQSVTVDGLIGSNSLQAIKNAIEDGKLHVLHNKFKDEMQSYYNDIVSRDSTQSVFINGWTNRVNAFSDKLSSSSRNVHCQQ